MESHHRPEYIAEIASTIQNRLTEAIREIQDIHQRSQVISINARIEAARSGIHGKGFKIVAEEFGRLNNEIERVSEALGVDIQQESARLMEISDTMAKSVRGQRLSQIALSVMDVIDRNLYERSCDVRWWATDPAAVTALEAGTKEAAETAGKRFSAILDAYTVYLDIVLVDSKGRIIANGRPQSFRSAGASAKSAPWFTQAMAEGGEGGYAFQGVNANSLVGGAKTLVYGSAVASGVAGNDGPVGALGILFNWEGLGKAVLGRVTGIDLKDDIETFRIDTKVHIVDSQGIVLASTVADSEGAPPEGLDVQSIIAGQTTDYRVMEDSKTTKVIAWGYSPGFETYATGWYCIIEQRIDSNGHGRA